MSRQNGLLEVYQNPHPALSHGKMWERGQNIVTFNLTHLRLAARRFGIRCERPSWAVPLLEV